MGKGAHFGCRQSLSRPPGTLLPPPLDVRVLEAFKATGEGWQTKMNEALLE